MTTLLDTPAPTRKERTMLKRKMAATAEPETAPVTELPVGKQESTSVVTDNTDSEHAAEVVTDTSVEPATEPSVPDDADDDDVFAMPTPRTLGLPMVAFKPLQKDMLADDDEVPYAPPMTSNRFFDDDDELDEGGVDRPVVSIIPSDDEDGLLAFYAQVDANSAAETARRKAEEETRKEQQAKDEAKRKTLQKKRAVKRGIGKLMMFGGAAAIAYGALVPFVPGL